MELTATASNKKYSFEVVPFRDEEEKTIYYFVQMPDKGYMLAEKVAPKGNWYQVGGGAFTPDLQVAIFDAIDRTPVNALFAEQFHIDDLNDYYFNSLKGIQ